MQSVGQRHVLARRRLSGHRGILPGPCLDASRRCSSCSRSGPRAPPRRPSSRHARRSQPPRRPRLRRPTPPRPRSGLRSFPSDHQPVRRAAGTRYADRTAGTVGRATCPSPVDEPSAKPISVNLAQVADFVPQYTSYWCVGASLQMARSIITGDRNEVRRSQRRLWQMARDRSPSPYGGANPIGWTAALNDLGLGPYRLVSRPTFDAAVRTAARALADTGRPVGLVMWAGRHAWLMTGFESTGDPRLDDERVTRVRVMDPLYPHTSRWGRSPAPEPARVARDARAAVRHPRPARLRLRRRVRLAVGAPDQLRHRQRRPGATVTAPGLSRSWAWT